MKEVILYSDKKIQLKWNFIAALCAFWNPNIDQFQFPEGYMTITVLVVWNICGASHVGLILLIAISSDTLKKCESFLKKTYELLLWIFGS